MYSKIRNRVLRRIKGAKMMGCYRATFELMKKNHTNNGRELSRNVININCVNEAGHGTKLETNMATFLSQMWSKSMT